MLETILDYIQIPFIILGVFFIFYLGAAGAGKFAAWLAFRDYEKQIEIKKNKDGLLPCPHCGREASVDFDECSEQYVVYCHNPACSWRDTEEEAIEAWNARV